MPGFDRSFSTRKIKSRIILEAICKHNTPCSPDHCEVTKQYILPHLEVKWSDTPGQVPLCTWHWARAQWETGGPWFHSSPLPSLRMSNSLICRQVLRCLSFLLPSCWWLGDSHATVQSLNKRVCLIQLSPQGCAKWALVLCDRDNERAEGRTRGAEEGNSHSFRFSYFYIFHS